MTMQRMLDNHDQINVRILAELMHTRIACAKEYPASSVAHGPCHSGIQLVATHIGVLASQT